MFNPQSLHESEVAEIITALGSELINGIRGKEYDNKSGGMKGIQKASSISRATAGSTMVFPVICSKSLDIKHVSLVSKAIERNAVSLLRLAFSAYNITTDIDAISFLSKFHTNLDSSKINVDRFIDIMDGVAQNESANIPLADLKACEMIKEDCKYNINYFFEDDINESSINQFKIIKNKYTGNESVIREGSKSDPKTDEFYQSKGYGAGKAEYDYERDQEKRLADIEKDDRRAKRDERSENREIWYHMQSSIVNQLLTSDVKKANELSPSLVLVNFFSHDDKNLSVERQIVVGVKAKIYEVEPKDMMTRIINKNADSNIILKLVRASTREISFIKDFLLAIDQAKLDALAKSKRGSSTDLFKALERRALNGKIRRAMKRENDAKAISTIVISQDEADYMNQYNNVDVEDPKVIIPIMEKLNLLYFVIIDGTNEVVKFLLDGTNNYETITFDNLEKETVDQGYKKAINLITKYQRQR